MYFIFKPKNDSSIPCLWRTVYIATINDWQDLLKEDERKNVIVDSLKFLVANKRIELNAFVIMSNHIHLIWQPLFGFTPSAIQASFMKYTAQQLKRTLNEVDLEKFKVNKYDRNYQIWKREPLSIELPFPLLQVLPVGCYASHIIANQEG